MWLTTIPHVHVYIHVQVSDANNLLTAVLLQEWTVLCKDYLLLEIACLKKTQLLLKEVVANTA